MRAPPLLKLKRKSIGNFLEALVATSVAQAMSVKDLTHHRCSFIVLNLFLPTLSGTTCGDLNGTLGRRLPADTSGKNATPESKGEKLPLTESRSCPAPVSKDHPDHSFGRQPLEVPFSVFLPVFVNNPDPSLNQPSNDCNLSSGHHTGS